MVNSTFKVRTIGEILREQRLNKGFTTKQVSEIIKIRPEYLEALESGNHDVFPSEVYIKGFLKNYAKYLGVDKEKAMALYRRENTEDRSANIETPQKTDNPRFNFSLTPEKLIIAIILIVTLAIVYYLSNQVSTILRSPELQLVSPAIVQAGEQEEYVTSEENITFKGEISAGATLSLNGDNVTVNNIQQFEVADVSLNSGINEFVFVAESQFGKKTTLTLTVNKTTPVEEAPQQESVIEQPQQMGLSIKIINREANILVQTDGQIQMNRVLNVGETREFTARQSIIIQSPRPDSVNIIINETEYQLSGSGQNQWDLIDGEVQKTK